MSRAIQNEADYDQGYKTGYAGGLEIQKRTDKEKIMEAAASYFRKSNDTVASLLRKLADEL